MGGGWQGLSRLTIGVQEVLADLADLWQPSAFPIRCVVLCGDATH